MDADNFEMTLRMFVHSIPGEDAATNYEEIRDTAIQHCKTLQERANAARGPVDLARAGQGCLGMILAVLAICVVVVVGVWLLS